MKREGEGALFTGRFVVLHHEMPARADCDNLAPVPSHWDLMLAAPSTVGTTFPLKSGNELLTYRLMSLPHPKTSIAGHDQAATERISADPLLLPATRLANHREIYLTYEGEISGGRGSVRQIHTGTYTCTKTKDIRVVLSGQTLDACLHFMDWGEIGELVSLGVAYWLSS